MVTVQEAMEQELGFEESLRILGTDPRIVRSAASASSTARD